MRLEYRYRDKVFIVEHPVETIALSLMRDLRYMMDPSAVMVPLDHVVTRCTACGELWKPGEIHECLQAGDS